MLPVPEMGVWEGGELKLMGSQCGLSLRCALQNLEAEFPRELRCLREGWTSLGLLRVLFAAGLSPGLGCLFVRVVTVGNS